MYLLLVAIYIDRRHYRSIVKSNGHGWIACTICCGQQWISIDTSHTLLWSPAMAIDGHGTQSVVVMDGIYRQTVLSVCCGLTLVCSGNGPLGYWKKVLTNRLPKLRIITLPPWNGRIFRSDRILDGSTCHQLAVPISGGGRESAYQILDMRKFTFL